jgi:hypothetical protein
MILVMTRKRSILWGITINEIYYALINFEKIIEEDIWLERKAMLYSDFCPFLSSKSEILYLYFFLSLSKNGNLILWERIFQTLLTNSLLREIILLSHENMVACYTFVIHDF